MKSIDELIEQLASSEHENVGTRMNPSYKYHCELALKALVKRGEEAVPALVPLLESAEHFEVTEPSYDMDGAGGHGKVMYLAELAARGLRKIGEPARVSLGALTAALRPDRPAPVRIEVGQALLSLLGARGPSVPVKRGALKEAIDMIAAETDMRQLRKNIQWMGKAGRHAVPQLIDLIEHDDEVVRQEAVAALAECGAEAQPALEPLLAFFDGASGQLEFDIARALGAIGGIGAERALLEKLERTGPAGIVMAESLYRAATSDATRARAVAALEKYDDPAVSQHERELASRALDRLKPTD